MKRIKIGLYVSMILVLVVACEFAGITIDLGGEESGGETQVSPIEVGIDSPPNGATLEMKAVEISYHASSTEGVSAVELSVNGEVLSSIASPASDQKVVALKYTWQPTVSGSHTIRVRAQNSAGAWSDYVAATVNIESAQQPAAQQGQAQQQAEEPEEPEPTETPEELTIFDVEHDRDKVFYGGGTCGSREITISARVTQPEDVYVLVLFIRFADKESADVTKWDSGRAMSKKGEDTYSVTLQSDKITNYNAFEFAVMRYQMVAQDKQGNSIARTEVMDDLSIEVCP